MSGQKFVRGCCMVTYPSPFAGDNNPDLVGLSTKVGRSARCHNLLSLLLGECIANGLALELFSSENDV
jgi:hypothetical protein